MARRFRYPAIPSSEITPESVYLRRRSLLKAGIVGASAAAVAGPVWGDPATGGEPLDYRPAKPGDPLAHTDEALTPYGDITRYCNFYEFGTGKEDPARYAHEMTVDPWSVEVGGAVARPGKLHLEDLLGGVDLEERIYRLRCVEAWSMVIPWVGFPLYKLLDRFEPLGSARFVAFRTLYRREEMRGTRSFSSIIDWPYREGLRLDEARHPLTLLAVGLYGKTLPNQNGAPLRLVVPWKYGFKSIKSIVRIDLLEKQPDTSWQSLAPEEYGFYANVNPEVDHPRWSQKFERRLPSSFLRPNRIPTQLFNGYAEQVASLYSDLDLTRYY